MSCGIGHLYHSKTFGFDYWMIENPAFKPDDGNPLFYLEEVPLLKGKTAEEMMKIREVKLAFPGAKITDRTFGTFPDLPWQVKYTDEELKGFEQYWGQKYPDEAGSFFKSEHRWHGLIGEDCFERFLKATPMPWNRLSKGDGPDIADYEVGSWIIDVKTETTAAALYLDDLRLRVLREQVEKQDSPINVYQWAIYNPQIHLCQLYGWRERKDLRLIEQGGLAIRREAGIWISQGSFTPERDINDIAFKEAHSEQRYILDFKEKKD